MFGSRRRPNDDSDAMSVRVPAYAWRTCMFLSASVVLVLFVHTSLAPALPLFVSEFQVSYTLASWALTAYMVSGAVMTIIIGRLADIFGSRKVLLVELACFAVGVALAGFAQDFYSLLLIRALQGIAVANTPLAIKIIREQFPKEKFSIGASIVTASFSGGMVVGLVLGAQIVGELGWRAVFLITAPIAIAMLVIAWLYIGRPRPREHIPKATTPEITPPLKEVVSGSKKQVDVRGAIALAVTLTSFLLAITFASSIQSNQTEFGVFLGLGIGSLIIFFLIEKRSKFPLINLKIMFSRLMIVGNMIFLLAGVLEYLIFQSTPTLATAPPPSGFGLPVSASGLIQLPYAAMIIIFGLFAGVYIARKGPLQLLIPGVLIGIAAVGLLWAFHSTFLSTTLALAILGVGFTMVVTAANYTMITSNPIQYTGLISSTATDLRVIGGAIGPVIAGTFMSLYVVPYDIGGTVEYYPSPLSFDVIFLIAFLFALAQGALIFLFRHGAVKVSASHIGDAAAA